MTNQARRRKAMSHQPTDRSLLEVQEITNVQGISNGSIPPKIKRRSWIASFLAHLILSVVLACILVGSQRAANIVFQAERVDVPKMLEVDFRLAAVEDPEEPVGEEVAVGNTVGTETALKVDFGFQATTRWEIPDDLGEELLNAETGPARGEAKLEKGEANRLAGAIQKRVFEAGGKSGEVQFSLSWDTIADLDLHVITPGGDRIWFRNRRSACDGLLDVDRNANQRKLTKTPVENVRWLKGRPDSGRYTVLVHCFRYRQGKPELGQVVFGGPGAVPYQLLAKTGEDLDLQNESAESRSLDVYRYVYFSPSVRPDERKSRLAELEQLQAEEEVSAKRMVAGIRHPQSSDAYFRALIRVIERYPHTDTAIELLKIIPGRGK